MKVACVHRLFLWLFMFQAACASPEMKVIHVGSGQEPKSDLAVLKENADTICKRDYGSDVEGEVVPSNNPFGLNALPNKYFCFRLYSENTKEAHYAFMRELEEVWSSKKSNLRADDSMKIYETIQNKFELEKEFKCENGWRAISKEYGPKLEFLKWQCRSEDFELKK